MPSFSPDYQTPWRRDIGSTVGQAKSALSSWDGCMSVGYCKWPVIAGIIVGSLVLISLLWCFVRCLFCGAACCGGCFSCCNSCCPAPRKRGHKNIDKNAESGPFSSQYAPHPQPAYVPPSHNTPQFATFDVSTANKKFNEDALPAMPSWGEAAKRRVEEPHTKGDDLVAVSTDEVSRNNSANASTRLMSDAADSQRPTPQRTPSFDEFALPGQRPSVPQGDLQRQNTLPPPSSQEQWSHPGPRPLPGPGQMRSPSPAGYGYGPGRPSPRPSPGPMLNPQAGYFDNYQQSRATEHYNNPVSPVSPSQYSQPPPSYHTSPPVPMQQFRSSPSPRPMPPPTGPHGYAPLTNDRAMNNRSPYADPCEPHGGFTPQPLQPPQPPPPPQPSRSPYQAYNPRVHQQSPAPGSWRNV